VPAKSIPLAEGTIFLIFKFIVMTIGILIRTNLKDGKKGILDQITSQVVLKNKELRIETLSRELQVNNAADLFFRTFN